MVKKKERLLEKKLTIKKGKKKSGTVLVIKQNDIPSILADPNRFFKDEVEDAEMALFFR